MKTVEMVAIGHCGTWEQQTIAGHLHPAEIWAQPPHEWFGWDVPTPRFRRVVRLVSHMSRGKRRS